MEKFSVILMALLLGASMTFSGCGENTNDNNTTKEVEDNNSTNSLTIEQDGKALFFYSSTSGDHVTYDFDKATVTDLQNNSDDDLVNLKLSDSEKGRLFVWLDDKGDTNASNDEEKVVMFSEGYDFATDGNASFEDFFYIAHYHEEEENGTAHHHLAAHDNSEFNLTNVPAEALATNEKNKSLIRLNTYLNTQQLVEGNISAKLSTLSTPTTLCYAKTVTNDLSTRHYAMGVNGQLYIYNSNFIYIDQVTISESCEKGKAGVSAVSHHDEYGVVVFEAASQKLYLVDAHDAGIYHVHSSYEASKAVGSASVNTMVSMAPAEDEEGHEH